MIPAVILKSSIRWYEKRFCHFSRNNYFWLRRTMALLYEEVWETNKEKKFHQGERILTTNDTAKRHNSSWMSSSNTSMKTF